ncbi:MAG: site-specific DNA-methyltransferase [Gammaproteobacteria bacterium]|nr:site-specific DNA-methyltransferase [Gammaproteobacteria bacterium]
MPFLDWVNKNQAVQTSDDVPYHLLQHKKTYGDKDAAKDNLIIQGDNLQALKALLPFYTGKVKCIFIDPPYNTQSAFVHYDDKLEHSQWLSTMYPRLVLLRELLEEGGSLWITIDDDEAHYLKVMCDEVFGRSNFVANVVWQKKFSPQNDAKWLSDMHDHILIYAKNKSVWRPNKLKILDGSKQERGVDDGDLRGKWLSVDYTCNKNMLERPNLYYAITNPNTLEEIYPKETAVWRFSLERHLQNVADNTVYWGKNGTNKVPRYKNFKSVSNDVIVPTTVWLHQDVGNTQEAKKEVTIFDPSAPFSTPKPERLIERILHIGTVEGDLVLDSFLGSGTTAAVAHKMNRRYIGIEMGEHAQTHCIPRLQKVIDGEQGGISKTVEWQGGGGFSFYTLGDAVFDAEGHITSDVRFKDLAAYIWWLETKTATGVKIAKVSSPFIGEREGVAYYLLYNGILGDRRPNGGNVLTSGVLAYLKELHPHSGKKVIFGEASRLGQARLAAEQIEFKQIPYELHDRV